MIYGLQYLYNITLRKRRLNRITDILIGVMPTTGSILDLGCGNGDVTSALQAQLPDVQFRGLDLEAKPDAAIPVEAYDGKIIPFPDQSFDYVMLITVLHHTDDYLPILQEARRVARKGLIIFDHQYKTRREWWALAFIDWPGNVPFGVYTPCNFKTRPEWQALFSQTGLHETSYNDHLFFFGKYFDKLLGGTMHFLSILVKKDI